MFLNLFRCSFFAISQIICRIVPPNSTDYRELLKANKKRPTKKWDCLQFLYLKLKTGFFFRSTLQLSSKMWRKNTNRDQDQTVCRLLQVRRPPKTKLLSSVIHWNAFRPQETLSRGDSGRRKATKESLLQIPNSHRDPPFTSVWKSVGWRFKKWVCTHLQSVYFIAWSLVP